jgi:hypothetical protein
VMAIAKTPSLNASNRLVSTLTSSGCWQIYASG